MTKRGFIRFLFISDVDPADGKGHAAKQYLVKNDIIEVFIFYIAVIGMLRHPCSCSRLDLKCVGEKFPTPRTDVF